MDASKYDMRNAPFGLAELLIFLAVVVVFLAYCQWKRRRDIRLGKQPEPEKPLDPYYH